MSHKEVIYILGAGRSGSTVLATALNSHKKINAVGELHHFFTYLKNKDHCSCGRIITNCEYWSEVVELLPESLKTEADRYEKLCSRMEYHTSIPSHLLGFLRDEEFSNYERVQREIVTAIAAQEDSTEYVVDSAKYIGRYLSLKRIYGSDVKAIFLIRDLRGVIWSFKKKVQTQSKPYRTLVYYLFINTVSHLLTILPGYHILKIRYEDVVDNPQETFQRIGEFMKLDLSDCAEAIVSNQSLSIPHIIGGNRLKEHSEITIKKDDTWINEMPAVQKIMYYLMAFPLMLLNRYKILG